MKLKLTILMSTKAEVSSKGKYCLNKNSVEPPMVATAVKSYYKFHLCKGTSEALFPPVCRLIASSFETGDRRNPTDKLVIIK